MQNGIALVTLVVRVDVNQLLSWSDANFQSGLGNVINVIARMLHGQDESGGLVIRDLMLHLLRKAGEAVLPVLLDLLEALLGRMRTAKTASFLQVRRSFILVSFFAESRSPESCHPLRIPYTKSTRHHSRSR